MATKIIAVATTTPNFFGDTTQVHEFPYDSSEFAPDEMMAMLIEERARDWATVPVRRRRRNTNA